ncbi:MAG: hypothetical protein V2G41_09245 [bacterium JZ-2024 1]
MKKTYTPTISSIPSSFSSPVANPFFLDRKIVPEKVARRWRRSVLRHIQSRNTFNHDEFSIYAQNPIAYFVNILRIHPTPDQERVILSVRDHQKTVVSAAHDVGKTYVAAGLVQWFLDCFRDSIVITTSPTWSQTRDLLWAKIYSQRTRARVISPAKFTDYDCGIPMRLFYSTSHYAKAHNAKDQEGFQGEHREHIFIILDEASGVNSFIWKAARTMIQSPNARLLAMGNCYHIDGDFPQAIGDPSWNTIVISALDHPNIIAELQGLHPPIPDAIRLKWVLSVIREHCQPVSSPQPEADTFEFPQGSGRYFLPDDDARVQLLGLKPRENIYSRIWSPQLIDSAFDTIPVSPDILPRTIAIGVDVGDKTDLTVAHARRGPRWIAVRRWALDDSVSLATQLANFAIETALHQGLARSKEETQSLTIFNIDETGLGGGLCDILQRDGWIIHRIQGASRADNDRVYSNRRSEIHFSLADRARQGLLDLSAMPAEDAEKLRQELLSISWDISRGRRAIEKKSQIRARLKRSPDDADSLAYAFVDSTASPERGGFIFI